MTDSKSIEERLAQEAADWRGKASNELDMAQKASGPAASLYMGSAVRMDAYADLLDKAAAELRRRREELEAERTRMALMSGIVAALTAETARRESAEALLRDRLSERPDGGWVAAEEHFARYAPSGSGDTKETDR